MQRRQLFKYLLPVGLAAAGLSAGILMPGRSSSCTRLTASRLLQRLHPFSDVVLGKATALPVGNGLQRFDALCEENFEAGYRALVVQDFAAGKLARVDDWLLSETEALTHRAVYLSNVRQGVGSMP
jgi:hypothetical protein